MKKWIIRSLLIVALVAGGYGAYTALSAMTAQRQSQVATAKVRQNDVIVRSFARGELQAVRSVSLTAPNLFGTVQVTRLAALGAFAREKDRIVEFDDAEVLSRLEEKQLEIDQIDEQLKKAQADLAIRTNQDQVELLRAKYGVRRAELEVRKNEIVSVIDAKKNLLSLDETKKRLSQLESDIKSRREQAEAELAVLREKRNKANLEMARERARLDQIKLLSPISGLVAIRQNRSSVTMFGMQLPDIREGDQIQPGMPVADVLDLSEMEVLAKVGELDRANLREGQEVNMRLDAVSDKTFSGRIKAMSATASANMFSSDPAKKFDVVFSIDMKQLLSALGAKPAQIQKVLATAEANRRKPQVKAMAAMPAVSMPGAGGMGEAGAGGAPGGAAADQSAGAPGPAAAGAGPGAGAGAGAAGRRSGGGMMAGLTPEQQKKFRDAQRKVLGQRSMQELSPEERADVFAKVRKEMAAAGVNLPDARPGGRSQPEAAGAGLPMLGPRSPYSKREIENAKLPAPPEEDSQVDVLLRPGLLADVEIIVEKIPDAINIPTQAIFEREGRLVVFVLSRGKFEERVIQPSKRSESTMVIASGLKPGEVVALADPTARPGDSQNSQKGKGAGVPMPRS